MRKARKVAIVIQSGFPVPSCGTNRIIVNGECMSCESQGLRDSGRVGQCVVFFAV